MYIPTGNEQVSIPTLSQDGGIENINVMSMHYRGLIEFCGSQASPFMQPYVINQGSKVEWELQWNREDYWIPRFQGQSNNFEFSGEIVAPLGERGFYYSLSLKNKSDQHHNVEVGMEGTWTETLHTINESKTMRATKTVLESGWNHSIVFELMNEAPIMSFAPMTCTSLDRVDYEVKETENEVSYTLGRTHALAPGETTSLCFYWGIGLEEVGAATSAKEMLRKGSVELKDHLKNWLQERSRSTGEQELDEVMNVNLFFNYFYATGKTIDSEEDVLVTSRSPRYYVSAAYWDRDSLLWSFPSILVTDAKRARSMLDYVFTTQRKNIGIHSRYIDGVVLEPGFELDELCAPVIALHMYLEETGDWSYVSRSYVKDSLDLILERLEEHKHPSINLYDTFLQPTDDPIVYPYLTYNNVLVWKVYKIVAQLGERGLLPYSTAELHNHAQKIKEAIYNHAVVEEETGSCFAWSFDLKGNYNVYDEPPGSLQLLPYYEFCSFKEPIYQNTVQLIRSDRYEYAFKGKPFEELGCAHANHPWVLSIANSFLSGREKEARDLVLRSPMDGGIACESIDEYTGEPRTGEHFATCAGFLAFAIYQAYGLKQENVLLHPNQEGSA